MSYLKLGIAAVIALIIAGLIATAAIYRGNAISAEAEAARAKAILATALEVNADNEKTMTAQAAAQARADQLAADLAAEIDVANQSALAVARTLAELRAKNADVDAYLKLPVPAALRGMYDGTATGGH